MYMEKKERQEKQQLRWEEWRQKDFDYLLTMYTRVVNDFAVCHFTMRDLEDQKELAEDSSFLLDQLRQRYHMKEPSPIYPRY